MVSDGNRITVNGKPIDEPYVPRGDVNPAADPYDVRVPDGRLFLLGDHRGNSNVPGSVWGSGDTRPGAMPGGRSRLCRRGPWRRRTHTARVRRGRSPYRGAGFIG